MQLLSLKKLYNHHKFLEFYWITMKPWRNHKSYINKRLKLFLSLQIYFIQQPRIFYHQQSKSSIQHILSIQILYRFTISSSSKASSLIKFPICNPSWNKRCLILKRRTWWISSWNLQTLRYGSLSLQAGCGFFLMSLAMEVKFILDYHIHMDIS